MLKIKGRNDENNVSPAKKKKVSFTKSVNDKKMDNINNKKVNIKRKLFKGGKNNNDKLNKNQNSEQNMKKLNKQENMNKKGNFVKSKNANEQANGERPNWSEMKKEKKQLRMVRRKSKATAKIFEISHKAKLLAAQIQRKVVKQDFRMKSCKELHGLLKGQYKSIALTHDLSRVIQVLLKYSSEDIKSDITEELLDVMVQMAQSKYAHHSVKRILKYGTDFIRHEVIKRFSGHIVSLATHSVSAPVLDYAYGEFATKKEKQYMQQEFYGEIYRNTKDDKVKTLSDTYKDSPEMKPAILHSCKANIQRILDKNLHDSELFQTVLYDYIRECSSEDRAELISTLSPLIVPLTNSLSGVNAACMCVWLGTNKDKKTILKVVKEHVLPLCKHKTGYRLLLAIFDSVDDTVLVKKTIVSTLASNLKDLAKDHWGNMILHWLVKPKDSAMFHPNLIKFLEEGFKSGNSKKDADIRVSELREAILPALLKDIESDPSFWLSDKATMLLTIAVLSTESTKECIEALANIICQPMWTVKRDEKDILAIEDAAVHMCLKKLVALDSNKTNGTLGEAISNNLEDTTIEKWLPTNRGCFFLLKTIESNKDVVVNKLLKLIKPHMNLLKQQTTEGAKLLLHKVQNK